MKKFSFLLILLAFCVSFASCSKDETKDEPNGGSVELAGTWVDGDEIMVLGKNGSYRWGADESFRQYRMGTYAYNSKLGLLVINFEATSFNNAYQDTYIVQTLTSTTLVLLYTDGDVEGFYTKRSRQ